MKNIRVTTVLFNNTITSEEVYYFRGAIIKLTDNSTIFHNHIHNNIHHKYQYTYPLVQYKRLGESAALVGINQGAKAIEQLFGSGQDEYCIIGERNITLQPDCIYTAFRNIEITEDFHTYSLENWLPFNTNNNKEFSQLENDDRIDMLNRILVGNILSFSKNFIPFFKEKIYCQFVELEYIGHLVHKGMEMKSFNAIFKTNVLLPDHIGLGRGVSTGHGTIIQVRGK